MTALLVVLVVAAAIAAGLRGVRMVRSTDDFLLASRTVSTGLNGAAVAGEYLSLASFLGIAGLVLSSGVGMLWYAVGFASGFVALLIWVAGPLRRSGAFTVGDFAERRLGSPRLRRLTGLVVLVIGWLYLVPQLRGAGAVLRATAGTPYWVGVVFAGTTTAVVVVAGGMRSATYVQAFQYAVKLLFLVVPAVVLVLQAGPAMWAGALHPEHGSHFPRATTVRFVADTELRTAEPVVVRLSGGAAAWAPGSHRVPAGTAVTFPADSAVPALGAAAPLGGDDWRRPLLDRSGAGHPLFETWSVLIATMLGTMGLPHILLRFHTSPTGRSARRAAVVTVGLLGAFYLFPGVYGLLGRIASPQLYLTGETDTVALVLPGAVLGGSWGGVLSAVVTAGAYAAILSVSAGLLLTLAAGVSRDLRRDSVHDLRLTVVGAAAVAVLLALPAGRLDISVLVGWAFALAAATLCPLLVLGLWWRGLTTAGAAAGVAVGAVATLTAEGISLLAPLGPGWWKVLLLQPAAWALPLAAATMVLVSLAGRPPVGAEELVLSLHVPEASPVRPRPLSAAEQPFAVPADRAATPPCDPEAATEI